MSHPTVNQRPVRMAGFTALLAVATMNLLSASSVQAQAKPNLRVSAIATPGGLCAGNENKVRVSITNNSLAGVRESIPVILFVSQPPNQPTSYLAHLEKGIGPQTTTGQPVWFHDVVIPATGSVTLRAVVNPDQQIEESNYNDNDRIQNVRVTRTCGAAPEPPAGNTLTVYVFKSGTWSGQGFGQHVGGANVAVTCGTFSGSGTTGANGTVAIPNVPKSPPICNIAVNKGPNCSGSGTKNMGTYATKVNVEIPCD